MTAVNAHSGDKYGDDNNDDIELYTEHIYNVLQSIRILSFVLSWYPTDLRQIGHWVICDFINSTGHTPIEHVIIHCLIII